MPINVLHERMEVQGESRECKVQNASSHSYSAQGSNLHHHSPLLALSLVASLAHVMCSENTKLQIQFNLTGTYLNDDRCPY